MKSINIHLPIVLTFQNFVEYGRELFKVEGSEEAQGSETEGDDGRDAALQCCVRFDTSTTTSILLEL